MPRTTTGATSGSSTERARPVIVELIRSLYRYNDWANGRILDASARLTCEQLLEGGGASFDSVRDTLVHTMGAEWLYLERWHGRSPRASFAAADFPDLATIRARWQTIERDTQAFVATLTEADLARVVEYTNMQGEVGLGQRRQDRKSTRLNSSHVRISYAVFCLKKKNYS